jgi:hypothetical protein
MTTAEMIARAMNAENRKPNGYFLAGVSNHQIGGIVNIIFKSCATNYSKGRSVTFVFPDGSSLTAKCWPNNVYSCYDWVVKN